MSNSKFEKSYKSIEDKIKFLESFNLLNLQKAGCIGMIPLKKMEKKSSAIKSILEFDIKNKFLICKTIFANIDEYRKERKDDNQVLKTTEWNQFQFDNMKTEEWEKVKDNLTKELSLYKETLKISNENIDNKKQKITTVVATLTSSTQSYEQLDKEEEEEAKLYSTFENKIETIKMDVKNVSTKIFDKKPNKKRRRIKKIFTIEKLLSRKIQYDSDYKLKQRARQEIDKLYNIEKFETIDDVLNNKKTIIFKGSTN